VFQGETPYSQAALEVASGLKVGSTLTQAGLQTAGEQLIATGAFADVGVTVDGPVKAVDVIFKVAPIDAAHMLRVSFDNFVWFSHDELVAEVRGRVPLFNGVVPEGGSLQDAVRDALQQILAAKGVNATVASQLVAPHPGLPFRIAEYHIESPEPRIHGLEIAGVPAASKDATDKVVHSLIGASYVEGLVGGWADRILADYRDAGYQEAALTGIKRTIVSSTAARVDVDVSATLIPGELYRVSKLEWTGSPEMSAAAFAGAAKAHAGDVASQQAVLASLEKLDAAYRNVGYMDVIVNAAPKLDAAKHEVAFTLSVIPGPQYKLRNLHLNGLSAAQRSDFDSTWKLHSGDLYNAGYVATFLTNNTVIRSLSNYSASFRVKEDPEAAVLDLDITFAKFPGK
jgi:outer membrane protein insertion porin family